MKINKTKAINMGQLLAELEAADLKTSVSYNDKYMDFVDIPKSKSTALQTIVDAHDPKVVKTSKQQFAEATTNTAKINVIAKRLGLI